MSVRLSAGAEQKGSKTEEGELGSNLGPDSSEYRLKCRYKTQNRAKRFNKIDNQKLVRDQGVGGSNPLSPTIFSQVI